MLNFLENHDEQRFASDQFAGDADKVLPGRFVNDEYGAYDDILRTGIG